MIFPPRTILGLAVVGDDLHAARVRIGPLAARVTGAAVVERFLDRSPAEAQRALAGVASGVRRATLVAPGQWCTTLPIELDRRGWLRSREEILASIDQLAPIPAGEALAGLVEVGGSGVLCVVRTDRVRAWADAAAGALGGVEPVVVSPLMAALGLGLQRHGRAIVYEPAPLGEWLRHETRLGLPVVAAEPADGVEAHTDADAVVVLPGGDAEATVTGVDLAAASAVAPVVAPGVFEPISRRAPMARAAWSAPAAGAALAAALMIAAPIVTQARHERALARLAQQERAMEDDFARVSLLRREVDRLSALVDEVVAPATAGWASALPPMAEAAAALPPEGFLSRLDLDGEGVTIAGEAPDTAAMLSRLEASPALANARRIGRLAPGAEPGLDVFEMRADREHGGGDP
ncbi:MAG: hypothetical protein D6693_04740 [Planctomycetota bacterium]|nr:MAG: hypothetical protein D6693_04740 [Planctomycetota bacterium]